MDRRRLGDFLGFRQEAFQEVDRLGLGAEVGRRGDRVSRLGIRSGDVLIVVTIAGFAPPPGFQGGPRKSQTVMVDCGLRQLR